MDDLNQSKFQLVTVTLITIIIWSLIIGIPTFVIAIGFFDFEASWESFWYAFIPSTIFSMIMCIPIALQKNKESKEK